MIIAFDEYKSPVLTTGKWNHYNINKGQSYQFFTGIDPEGIFLSRYSLHGHFLGMSIKF